jgi:hypothetical protein
VTPDEDNVGQIIVFDPQENYRIAYRAPSYEDAVAWLFEDDFSLVGGRMFRDDGFPLHTKAD